MEMSYMDLLNKLYDDVESDVCMPERTRKEVLEMLSRLMGKLIRYSN